MSGYTELGLGVMYHSADESVLYRLAAKDQPDPFILSLHQLKNFSPLFSTTCTQYPFHLFPEGGGGGWEWAGLEI